MSCHRRPIGKELPLALQFLTQMLVVPTPPVGGAMLCYAMNVQMDVQMDVEMGCKRAVRYAFNTSMLPRDGQNDHWQIIHPAIGCVGLHCGWLTAGRTSSSRKGDEREVRLTRRGRGMGGRRGRGIIMGAKGWTFSFPCFSPGAADAYSKYARRILSTYSVRSRVRSKEFWSPIQGQSKATTHQ